MKKLLVVFAVLFLASSLFAADEQVAAAVSGQQNAAENEMVPNTQHNFGIGIGPNNTVLFRFLNTNWYGDEIPLSVNYNTSNSNQVMSTSVSSGYGLVFPLKIIGGLHINFIPEITGGYARSYSNVSSVEENDATKPDSLVTVLLKDQGYSLSAGLTAKLEVEYFINHLVPFLPGDISIGGYVSLSGTDTYSESYSQTYNKDVDTIITTHTCYWGVNSSLTLTGTTLSSLVIKYYF